MGICPILLPMPCVPAFPVFQEERYHMAEKNKFGEIL